MYQGLFCFYPNKKDKGGGIIFYVYLFKSFDLKKIII